MTILLDRHERAIAQVQLLQHVGGGAAVVAVSVTARPAYGATAGRSPLTTPRHPLAKDIDVAL